MTNPALSTVFPTSVTPTWDDPRDRGLLERLAEGEGEALGELYDLHADALFGHALALVAQPSDAEDLVQVVFAKLASMGSALLGVRRPGAYLHRMLRTAAIDMLRGRAVRSETTLADCNRAAAPLKTEETLDLRRALADLPAAQREAVWLHLVEGLSFREIGASTGVPTFTAASRYRLGMGRLRRRLRASASAW